MYGCPRVKYYIEINANLLRCLLLKEIGCSNYLKCRTVETVNGVTCAAKEFIRAFEVHVHMVRTSKEAAPTAFRVGFADAGEEVELRFRRKDRGSF